MVTTSAVLAHQAFNAGSGSTNLFKKLQQSLSQLGELEDPDLIIQSLYAIQRGIQTQSAPTCNYLAQTNAIEAIAENFTTCIENYSESDFTAHKRAVLVKYLVTLQTIYNSPLRIRLINSGIIATCLPALMKAFVSDQEILKTSLELLATFAPQNSQNTINVIVPKFSKIQDRSAWSNVFSVEKTYWQLCFTRTEDSPNLECELYSISSKTLAAEFRLKLFNPSFSLALLADCSGKHTFSMDEPSYQFELKQNADELSKLCASHGDELKCSFEVKSLKTPPRTPQAKDLFSHVPEHYKKYLEKTSIEYGQTGAFGLPEEGLSATTMHLDEAPQAFPFPQSTSQTIDHVQSEVPIHSVKVARPTSKFMTRAAVPAPSANKAAKPAVVTAHWGKTKIYRRSAEDAPAAGEPYFPEEFNIEKHDVFMCTDIKENHNKFYSLELHIGVDESGITHYRIYTHYGRSDDLEKNAKAGRRETRYPSSEAEALSLYDMIVSDKTSAYKGYKRVELASLNVGSSKAQDKVAETSSLPASELIASSSLHPTIASLVQYIYEEATAVLTNVIAGKITSRGIETPLGILTHEQINKGRKILYQIYDILEAQTNPDEEQLMTLSSEFYSYIPHKFGGRSREDIEKARIQDVKTVEEKLDLLQLMTDMLQVNQDGRVLFNNVLDMKYKALKCDISVVDPNSWDFRNLERDFLITKENNGAKLKVVNIYKVKREVEYSNFKDGMDGQKLLFHGSRISNYVGLLSRGLLMPHIVVKSGVKRTDVGFLGNGIYFGSEATTSAQYTTSGKKGTRLMLMCRVGLGRIKEYTQKVFGINSAPEGYDSVRGVRSTPARPSEFKDDEYVIYNTRQQRIEYLVEFAKDNEKIIVEQPEEQHHVPSFRPAPAPITSTITPYIPESSRVPVQTAATSAIQLSQQSLIAALSASLAKATAQHKTVAEVEEEQAETTAAASSSSEDGARLKNKKEDFDLTLGTQEYSITEMKRIEDRFRELYATERSNPELEHPYLFLIDAFENMEFFKYQEETQEELEIPKILTKERRLNREGLGIVDRAKFFENWNDYTRGMLNGMDWNNLFVAGGAVLQNLVTENEKGYNGTDIDLFLYGLSEKEANKKLAHVYEIVKQNTKKEGEEATIIRTKNAVTIIGNYPYRHIQIVLRLYKSPAEVLMGFDIDSCCVGFDGRDVWVLPRCRRSIVKGFNLCDLSRRSLTYEIRLFKYSKRGFAVAVPGLNRSLIDPMLFNRNVNEMEGLAKLLLFEYNVNNDRNPYAYSPLAKRRLMKFMKNKISVSEGENEDKMAELDQAVKHDPSDYSIINIPWGPQWSQWMILRLLKYHDKAQLFNTKHHKHVFVHGIDAVINGIRPPVEGQEEEPKESSEEDEEEQLQELSFKPSKKKAPKKKKIFKKKQKGTKFENVNDEFRKPLTWLTENPGRQLLTGSFHPVDDDKWDQYVYMEEDQQLIQQLCNAAFCGNIEQIVELERKKADVNGKDNHLARTPLQYACIYGHAEAAKVLIGMGGKVDQPDDTDNGFTSLHYAILNGHDAVVETLLEFGASVNLSERKYKLSPLHLAAYYNRPHAIRLLLHKGAKADAIDAQCRFPLHLAALSNHFECIQELATANVSLSTKAPKKGYDSALHAAVRISLQCVAALCKNESGSVHLNANLLDEDDEDTSAENQDSVLSHDTANNKPSVEDQTFPLLSAANLSDVKAAKKHIHSIENEPAKVTALHIAAKHNCTAIMKLLLDEGGMLPFINCRDVLAQTPLHYAAKHGADKAVKVLINNGAMIDAKNIYGQTPLHYALDSLGNLTSFSNSVLYDLPPFDVKRRFDSVRKLLLQKGAQHPTQCPNIPAQCYSIPPLPTSVYLLEYPYSASNHYENSATSQSRLVPRRSRDGESGGFMFGTSSAFGSSSMLQPQLPNASNALSLSGPSLTTKALTMINVMSKGNSISEEEKVLLKKLIIAGQTREIFMALQRYEAQPNIGRLISKFKRICKKFSELEEEDWFAVDDDTSTTTSSSTASVATEY